MLDGWIVTSKKLHKKPVVNIHGLINRAVGARFCSIINGGRFHHTQKNLPQLLKRLFPFAFKIPIRMVMGILLHPFRSDLGGLTIGFSREFYGFIDSLIRKRIKVDLANMTATLVNSPFTFSKPDPRIMPYE